MWARVYADGVFGSGSPSPHRSKVDVDAEREGSTYPLCMFFVGFTGLAYLTGFRRPPLPSLSSWPLFLPPSAFFVLGDERSSVLCAGTTLPNSVLVYAAPKAVLIRSLPSFSFWGVSTQRASLVHFFS